MAYNAGWFGSPGDGTRLATYAWGQDIAQPRAVVQIAHGLAEHAARYDRLATALVAAGYRVAAIDHRGHGKSVASPAQLGRFEFAALVADVAAYGAELHKANARLPLFLIAHSMGSFAAQHVLLDHSTLYAGVVLSGSTVLDVLAAQLGGGPAPKGLEAFNAGFEQRTGYEWLSRDAAEVDKYVADPLCGFPLPDGAAGQMFWNVSRTADPTALSGIRADLPVLLASGQADPLAGGGKLIELLGQRYRGAGLRDVTVRIYPGARHEIFNETNRAEVTADVIGWLDAHGAQQP